MENIFKDPFKPSHFTFQPPVDCIAISSNTFRDECRLMIVNRSTYQISHCRFKEIFNFFEPEDVIIFNSSTVVPSTVEALKTFNPNSDIEEDLKVKVTILNNQGGGIYEVKVDNPRRVREGNILYFGSNGLSAVVIDVLGQGYRTLRFRYEGTEEEIEDELQSMCLPFIPDYSESHMVDMASSCIIQNSGIGDEYRRHPKGERHYQTVYARYGASIISPSAGTHFSKTSLLRGKLKDIKYTYINIDCGLGDKTPIDLDAALNSQSYPCEKIAIDGHAVKTINEGIAGKHRICAVGTSVLRAMETAHQLNGEARPYDGIASNFIYPGHTFGSKVDCLLTGFHFGTANTNLMAVCAFAGNRDLIFEAYHKAIKHGYYFGEYGDAMLIVA